MMPLTQASCCHSYRLVLIPMQAQLKELLEAQQTAAAAEKEQLLVRMLVSNMISRVVLMSETVRPTSLC